MINPIVIIVMAAILLSVLVVCIINKPKKPIITGTLIFILICFVTSTWFIDNAISSSDSSQQFIGFVSLITLNDNPTVIQLEESFNTFMIIDIVLFILSLLSLAFEAMYILKSDRRR